jgi:hypothetical protein
MGVVLSRPPSMTCGLGKVWLHGMHLGAVLWCRIRKYEAFPACPDNTGQVITGRVHVYWLSNDPDLVRLHARLTRLEQAGFTAISIVVEEGSIVILLCVCVGGNLYFWRSWLYIWAHHRHMPLPISGIPWQYTGE